ncbi:uncharacterized protein BCR38DRAFT_481495 [Pseudomassariella vexata]|uniref:Nephrocystin 3-like N-terminal domain-containing protein n=1 Tax=Pseudomassariella vexata TaxID=1141098 RepID=A0A1Y2EFL1_9PEZI|nr:uncharacterized protein BCR38DRAFT_481495 [Pseudomassariella vexata]ORY70362.1 hypothetical protein BCR38DRAFT_481495 [Pseudomassariella vexata]
METQHALPSSLRAQMSDRNELAMFNDWCQEESSVVHPAFAGGNNYYDSQKAEMVPREAYHDLKELIVKHLENNPIPGLNPEKCTMDDVYEQARIAEDEYNSRDASSRFRSWTRNKAPSLASNLGVFTEMFPDEYGLSVVAGSLSVIFNAVTKIADNREKIFHFFQEIPDILRDAKVQHNSFPKDPTLTRLLKALHQAVLLALTGLLDILQPRKHRGVFKTLNISKEGSRKLDSFFQVETTADQIDKITQSVRDSNNRLNSYVSSLSFSTMGTLKKSSSENLLQTRAVRQTQHTMMSRMSDGFSDVRQDARDGFASLQEQQEKHAERMEATLERAAQTFLYRLVHEGFRNYNLAGLESPYLMATNYALPAPSMPLEELFDILHIDLGVVGDQLMEVVNKSNAFEPNAMRQASWLLRHKNFKYWLASPQSGTLLVDGFCGDQRIGRHAPISSVSGTLAVGLPKIRSGERSSCYVLCYFCGLNSYPDNESSGPTQIVRSLLAQLIASLRGGAKNLDLSFIAADADLHQDLMHHNISGLLHIFRGIVSQLPYSTVLYCIIDDLSSFETDDRNWRNDLRYLVNQLRSLIDDLMRQPGKPAFKLLMTSSHKSMDIYELIPEEEQISLRAGHLSPSPLTQLAVLDGLDAVAQMPAIETPRRSPLIVHRDSSKDQEAIPFSPPGYNDGSHADWNIDKATSPTQNA